MFRQVTQRLPWVTLDALVAECRADKGVRTLTTRDMLLTSLFAQLSDPQSLSGIEHVPQSQDVRRYHSGLPDIRRSTLADAAAKPPTAVFTGVLAALITDLMRPLRSGVRECIRLIDQTTMPLSGLSSAWPRFSAKPCGVEAHVACDPGADCPLYVGITPARINHITAGKAMLVEPGVTYVFDLGYYDYGWWVKLDAAAEQIASLYKRRWVTELFFRWVKQTAKLRHFFGTSENAVRIQVAVALIAFVLIKLAHAAQHAIERLAGRTASGHDQPVQNNAQGRLL